MKTHYQLLEIPITATLIEIKKAYFSLIRKYHPERFPKEFMAIREAYEVLSNDTTRKEYDLIEQLPENVREDFAAGKNYYEEGDLELSIKIFKKIHEKYPNLLIVNSLLGEAYFKNDNTGKAVKIFEALVKQESQNASFAAKLAQAYLLRGWQLKAIEQYKRALELDEDNVSNWSGLIRCYISDGNFTAAYQTIQTGFTVSARNGWDNLELYFHLVQFDLLNHDKESFKKHLTELKVLVQKSNNEEQKNNVLWFFGYLTDNFLTNSIFEIALLLINFALEIDPENKEIKRLRATREPEFSLFEKTLELKNEPIISEILIELLQFEIKSDGCLCKDCEITRLSATMEFLFELKNARKELLHLKKFYPELFALKRDFFNDVLNEKKEVQLKMKLFNQIKKYKKNGLLDNFEEEDDNDDDEVLEPYRRTEPKIGRNDPCPCGSGKKYKKCCLDKAE